jgi:glycosyltransferase involved in cell wall biosynthesis
VVEVVALDVQGEPCGSWHDVPSRARGQGGGAICHCAPEGAEAASRYKGLVRGNRSKERGSAVKVAIVALYPLTGQHFGAPEHIGKLAQHVSALDDMEVHVVTMGDRDEEFKDGTVNVHVVKKRMLLLPLTMLSIRRTIEKVSPDVVHAMRGFPYMTVATSLRKTFPSLITVFGVSAAEIRFDRRPVNVIKRLLISIPNEKYVIPRAAHIIVQSRFTEQLVRRRTRSKIHLVPEGVDCHRIGRLPSVAPPYLSDIFIPVNFRRLKGLDILIRAIAIVKETVPDVRLDIAGSGEEEEPLRNLVKALGLESNVRFLGFIADEEAKYQRYKSCKLVVVPSRWDFEPFAPLDGAASGKPVIASRSANSSVVVDGETGFVYETEDHEQLAARIVEVLTIEDLRKRMGEAAREKAKEYDWPEIAERTVQVYRAAISDFNGGKASVRGDQ